MPKSRGGNGGGAGVVIKPHGPVIHKLAINDHHVGVTGHVAVPVSPPMQASMLVPGAAGLVGVALLSLAARRRRG